MPESCGDSVDRSGRRECRQARGKAQQADDGQDTHTVRDGLDRGRAALAYIERLGLVGLRQQRSAGAGSSSIQQ
jgi:hypothetical protein